MGKRNIRYIKIKNFFVPARSESWKYKKAEKEIFTREESDALFLVFVFFAYFTSSFLGYYAGKFLLPMTDVGVKEIGTIMTALSAGVITLIISDKNRENEVDKHKEKWCSDFREQYSGFLAAINDFSRKMFKGVSEEQRKNGDAFDKIYSNAIALDEEIKEINRLQHVLALYLVSKYKDDPRYNILVKSEALSKLIRRKVSDINILGNKFVNGTDFDEDDASSYSSIVHDFEKDMRSDLVRLTIKVKVYLDGEWKKLRKGAGVNSYSKNSYFSILVFLLVSFCLFVWEV